MRGISYNLSAGHILYTSIQLIMITFTLSTAMSVAISAPSPSPQINLSQMSLTQIQ